MVILLECQNIKNIFPKGYTPNWSEEVFVIKKVIGIMKDEYGGVIIIEIIGIKAKIYTFKKVDGGESSTAKEVNIATEFNKFKDVLFNKKIINYKMKRIQAKKHKIET